MVRVSFHMTFKLFIKMLGPKMMNRNVYRLKHTDLIQRGLYCLSTIWGSRFVSSGSQKKSGKFLPAITWNFLFTFKSSCTFGKQMNRKAASAIEEATLRMHLPAVAFDTRTASRTSLWNAPVAINLRNTSSWSICARSIDLLIPWLTLWAIMSQIKMIFARQKRFL